MSAPHLSASTIAALIDHALPSDARRQAELHLSGCDQCREELASCARLTSSLPASNARRTSWPWLVAAAVVVIAIGIRARPSLREQSPAQERAPANSADRLTIVMPTVGAIVPRSELRFVWRRDAGSTGYRVIVTDASGAPAWSKDLADTSVALSIDSPLKPGARYFWRVEALHADGGVAQSTSTAFQVAP
jgi:hypothetical protein